MSQPIRTRCCRKEKDFRSLSHKTKSICISIDKEQHERILFDKGAFRVYLDRMISSHTELFPSAIHQGYTFHDILPESKKIPDIRLRRMQLKANAEVYTIRPSFVLPFMMGYTNDVEHALFLRRFQVPYWALTVVFGHHDMYWCRLESRFGQNSIVGTTIKQVTDLPENVIADEKHS